MPYRTELRRPDLKGTFRCSLCSKIFCHSSSLSRHRMQAHFKSYTCTLCNKEITSNETLRAHMYKKHQISRMFMCRCCNWAFPDKTSLHIHMQAMATGNPGNVSIIAKSSASPPPGQTPNGTPTSVNSCSPMVSSIFPAMPSREDLINKLREKAMMTGYPPPAGFDLSLLFPNFAKATSTPNNNGSSTERGDGNNNSMVHHRGSLAATTDIDDDMVEEINCEEPEDGMADIEYGGGDSLDGSDDGTDRKLSPVRRNSVDVSLKIKDESPSSAAVSMETGGLGDDSTPSPVSMVHQMKMPEPAVPQLQMPILRSAISASPLNSLMYHKKLTNVLRNKNNTVDQLLGSFLTGPGVYHSPTGANGSLLPTALHVSASSSMRNHHHHRGSSPPSVNTAPTRCSPAQPSLINVLRDSVVDCAMTSSAPDTGSHISPTDTTSSNSSAHSSHCRPSSVSPPSSTVMVSTTPTGAGSMTAGANNSAACFECNLVKGKLAQSENRCRFLESKTTSQESKISRLESRVSTLESNNRRYETEAVSLRDHCEILEKKILDCQERALRYLTNNNFDTETTKQILHDVLETCRVYKGP